MNEKHSFSRQALFTLSLFLLLVLFASVTSPSGPGVALAQDDPAPAQVNKSLTTPQLIQQAFDEGHINEEQRLLYLAYAVYEQSSLPTEYLSTAGWFGTTTVHELRTVYNTLDERAYTPATRQELERDLRDLLQIA